MGLRTNQPAKGYWFVPGGRIYKGETIARAFGRITLKELNKQVNFSKASLLDAYDHIYETNVFEEENISTHYVVLAYGVEEEDLQIENIINAHDDQHNEFRWISVEQAKLLKVHDNSRAYFSHIEKR